MSLRFANQIQYNKEVSEWITTVYHTQNGHANIIQYLRQSSEERLYKQIRVDIGHILSELCKRKGVEIIAAACMPDHVHMFVSIPPKYSVSEIMGYLKGKSSLMIFDRHANLKYKYGNRHFWCRGYYVDTVGKNAKKIEEYVRNQMQDIWNMIRCH